MVLATQKNGPRLHTAHAYMYALCRALPASTRPSPGPCTCTRDGRVVHIRFPSIRTIRVVVIAACTTVAITVAVAIVVVPSRRASAPRISHQRIMLQGTSDTPLFGTSSHVSCHNNHAAYQLLLSPCLRFICAGVCAIRRHAHSSQPISVVLREAQVQNAACHLAATTLTVDILDNEAT